MTETRPIIALDFPDKGSVEKFLKPFGQDESLYVKIGMELFYQEGPDLVRWLNSLGHDIFLDLKLHDIPNTVKSAMAGLAKLNVAMTNVHAAGGSEMMHQALEGLAAGTSTGQKRPKLIAVTQLTSTTEQAMQQDQQIMTTLEESVLHYAEITNEAGLDGVVCSAWEAAKIKEVTRTDFLCCTPGIRLSGATSDDQARIATPQKARLLKSSEIVVGRPITQAENPVEAYEKIKNAWNGAE